MREDKLIYTLYRDVEYEKDGEFPVYQEEPALVPYYEMTLPEGGVRMQFCVYGQRGLPSVLFVC